MSHFPVSNVPVLPHKSSILRIVASFLTLMIVMCSLAQPSLAAKVKAEAEPTSMATAADRFEKWNREYADPDQLYGARIHKLADYIEERFSVERPEAVSIVSKAVEHGNRTGVTPELLLAVIAVESTFKADAKSSQGARGLMQILPSAHRERLRDIGGASALFSPEKNIQMGTQILVAYIQESKGDMHQALARYNGSLGSKRRATAYSAKVMRLYRDFQDLSS